MVGRAQATGNAGVAGSAVAPDNRALSNVVLSRVALPTATQAT